LQGQSHRWVQYPGRLRRFDGHAAQNLELLVPTRIGHIHLEKKPVTLSFRQGIHPLGLDRVLGGDHDERFGNRIGRAGNRYLALGHELQHGGLHFGRSPVDLVGQHEVDENWPEFDVEGFPPR